MTTTTQLAAGTESMAERAYQVLRDRLIMMDIAPGDPINEAQLVAELGIGRTPLREALKRLEVDHLVQSYPRRGTFATRVDITELADISEMRFVLEPLAARKAVENLNEADRHDLEELRDFIQELKVDDDHRLLIGCDLKVHRLIYRSARNKHLQDTLVRLDNLATRIWCMALGRMPDLHGHIAEHTTLIDLVLGGDSEGASRMAAEHVLSFEQSVRSVL